MIDDLRIKNAILEEKLLKKMKQATYYKKKYLEDHRKIKEAIYLITEGREFEKEDYTNFERELLEILDKENDNGDN